MIYVNAQVVDSCYSCCIIIFNHFSRSTFLPYHEVVTYFTNLHVSVIPNCCPVYIVWLVVFRFFLKLHSSFGHSHEPWHFPIFRVPNNVDLLKVCITKYRQSAVRSPHVSSDAGILYSFIPFIS